MSGGPKRLLVTGAAGFIGSHLCETLLDQGHEIIGLDNFDPYYARETKERNLAAIREAPGFELIEADLRETDKVDSLFANHPIDAVIHLAARAGIRRSNLDSVGYVENNVAGTVKLLDAMARADCRNLVFASSSSVYGNREKVPFSEEDPVDRPISIYAMTKRAGEELCHVYAAQGRLNAICLRYFTVFGPRQRPEMAIHRFTRRLLAGAPIPMFGDGTMERDYTYVDDIVAGTAAAVDRVFTEPGFEIINLGNARPVSLRTLIDLLARTAGCRAVCSPRTAPVGEAARTYADTRRARERLGYDPGTSLEEGLRRFVEWYRRVELAEERPVSTSG